MNRDFTMRWQIRKVTHCIDLVARANKPQGTLS